jgi:hypothetical protein
MHVLEPFSLGHQMIDLEEQAHVYAFTKLGNAHFSSLCVVFQWYRSMSPTCGAYPVTSGILEAEAIAVLKSFYGRQNEKGC